MKGIKYLVKFEHGNRALETLGLANSQRLAFHAIHVSGSPSNGWRTICMFNESIINNQFRYLLLVGGPLHQIRSCYSKLLPNPNHSWHHQFPHSTLLSFLSLAIFFNLPFFHTQFLYWLLDLLCLPLLFKFMWCATVICSSVSYNSQSIDSSFRIFNLYVFRDLHSSC